MKEKTTFANSDEQIAYLNEKVAQLEIRARTAVFKKQRTEIRAEIERTKRLIRHLRKLDKGRIQHSDMSSNMEDVDE